jgi:hypothetical protein
MGIKMIVIITITQMQILFLMNTFPDEVLYTILTHLPLGQMLLVDKHINSLYNELYYKEMFPCGGK